MTTKFTDQSFHNLLSDLELNEVAGGMIARQGTTKGTLFPPTTGPTIPIERPPVVGY